MKHLSVAVLCLALACAPVYAADKKVAKAPAKPEQVSALQSPQVQSEYIGSLVAQLKNCRAFYLLDRDVFKMNFDAYYSMAHGDALMKYGSAGRVTEVELVAVREKAVKATARDSKFASCKSDATDELSKSGKQFIGGFSGTGPQGKAKELVAQWMTALEATGSDNFDQELSKFNTLANLVKLELTLK
jgi:hypothetical protein